MMMMNEFTNTITTSTPQLLRLGMEDTLSLKTGDPFQGAAFDIHFCINLVAAD